MDDLKAHLQQVDRAKLRHILVNHFDDGELRDLCFDLDISYSDLSGECARDKAREMIAYCERRGLWMKLITMVYDLRPRAPWPCELKIEWDSRESLGSGWISDNRDTADSCGLNWTCSVYYWANQTTTIV
jgi:hypothetical protein